MNANSTQTNGTPNPACQSAPSATPQTAADLAAMQGPPAEQPDQWLDSVMSLRSELKFDVRNGRGDQEGDAHVVIEDPVRSKFFQIGSLEYRFIASIDGERSAREILEQLNQESAKRENERRTGALTEDSVRKICAWLMNSNLVSSESVDNAKRLDLQALSLIHI